MSTYRKIHGRSIQAVTTDPTESVAEGQVWYNTTSDTFKSVIASEAWSSTSPLLQSRDSAGGAGIQTAAMIFGGRNEVDGGPTGGPNAQYNLTEEYNGTGYSTGGALVQGRQAIAGAGTQTAGLGVGGYHPPSPGPKSLVEEYNGSSWSEVTNQPTATFGQGSAGTQTSAVVFGGRGGPGSTWTNATYEYDGTNWTTGGAMGTARVLKGAATGTQTAALAVGGDLTPPGGATNKVEEYDGTSFSEVNAAPANIQVNMVSGIQTSALSFGGNISPYTTQAFKYDGTSFTATGSMASSASGQNTLKAAPDNSTGLSMGGYGTSSYIATSQEFNITANVITGAAWASGGLMGTGRYQGNGQNVGTKNAGMYSGGQGSYPSTAPAVTVSNVEEYDGSSWSEVNNMPESKAMFGAVGTQTAAFVFGGYGGPGAGPNPGPGGSPKSAALNYDGTNWTASPYSLPSAVAYLTGAGTSTAALSIGGHPALTTCNEYDGEGWTAGGSMTTGRHNSSAFGTQTAAIVAGGAPGASVEVDAESYNGTSWTAAADLIVNKGQAGTAGTQTDGLVFLGNAANPTNTIGWNGTSWFTQPSTSTARYGGSNGSTTTASAYYAGGGGSASGTTRQTTEEFTAESSVVTASTLTSS